MNINKLSASCLLLLPIVGMKAEANEKQRPNLLICIADDQSFPHTGAYGCKWVKTPSFDRVAKNGVLFTNTNAMINPITSYTIKGVLWYQCENNRRKPEQHMKFFPASVKEWRSQWGIGDLPFYNESEKTFKK